MCQYKRFLICREINHSVFCRNLGGSALGLIINALPDIKVSVVKRKKKFLMKYVNSANRLCQLFSVDALSECNSYV